MLNIVANTPLDLYKKTFLEMHKLDDIHNDPRNYKDVTAILSLLNYTQDPNVYLDENGFVSEFNYDEYIAGGNDWAKREIDHYNNEFVKSGKIDFLIKFFEHDPHTRRGVIDLWNNYELSSDKSFPCTVYAWFRKIGNELNMNYHMRACDAYKILLMDMHIGASLHVYISKKLGLKLGIYRHFVDSLHFYKEHKKNIDKLYSRLS